MERIRYYTKLLAIPLLFLAIFASLYVVWDIFDWPKGDELVTIMQVGFDTYGLPAVFLSSIAEGVLLVGNYFPGTFVIFLGVTLSGSVSQAIVVVAVVTIGLFMAHLFNYVLGKYGWYLLLVKFGLKSSIERAREKLIEKGPIAILLSYWLPNLGALTDTAAGIVHMPFKRFFSWSLISVTLWNILFGTVVFLFKDFSIFVVTPGSLGVIPPLIIVAVWMSIILIIDFFKQRKKKRGKETNMDDSTPL